MNDHDWRQYRMARDQVVKMIVKAKRDFKTSVAQSSGDSKAIWKLIKSLSGGNTSSQPSFIISDGNQLINDAGEIAEFFNVHSTTIAQKIKSNVISLSQNLNLSKLQDFVSSRVNVHTTSFTIPSITEESVREYLLKISANKATGVDGISIVLLKIDIDELVPHIVRLVNLSIVTKEFPANVRCGRRQKLPLFLNLVI